MERNGKEQDNPKRAVQSEKSTKTLIETESRAVGGILEARHTSGPRQPCG